MQKRRREVAKAMRQRRREVAKATRQRQREEAKATRARERLREYKRLKAEADELLRVTPELRQLAIDFYSARLDDDA